MGSRFSLDNFGTGYSSLTVLKRFPFHTVKIDRSFIAPLPGSPDERTLVETIIFMAHNLGLKVVAEGVETEAQLDLLCELGCDWVQGYFVGKPLAVAQVDHGLALQEKQACLN